MPNSVKKAFTLVELLVVVAIIVVLLALLAPAMDRAIYQTELALCAAQQHVIANGAQFYALDHGRRYPDRSAAMAGEANYASNWLTEPESGLDLRVTLSPYMPIAAFEDPLSPKISVERTGLPQDRDTYVFASNNFYFGWKFQAPGSAGMKKLGDSFSRNGKRFTTMVGELDWNVAGYPVTLASHPDRGGVLFQEIVQDIPDPVSAGLMGYPTGRFTFSRWIQVTGQKRGPMDMNFTFTDSSTQRFGDIEADTLEMARVPLHPSESGEYQMIPLK